MEIAKRDFDPSWSIPGDKGFAGEPKFGEVGLVFEEVKGNPEASDGFVALDIESLSLLASASASASSPIIDTGEKDSIAGTRATFKKTLSKKGSQRGGERRMGDSAVTTAAGGRETTIQIHVASEGDAASLPPEKTPFVVAVGAGGRSRRLAGRRQAPWLDPRRVVVLFATLSSMGTLILLYFTLSIGKMPGGQANAR